MNHLKSYETLNSQGYLIANYLYKTSAIKIDRSASGNLFTTLNNLGTKNIGYAIAIMIDIPLKNDEGKLIGDDPKFRNIELAFSDKRPYLQPRTSKSNTSIDDIESLSDIGMGFIYEPLAEVLLILSGVRKRINVDLSINLWLKSPTFREYYVEYGEKIMNIVDKCSNLGELYDQFKNIHSELDGRIDEFIKKADRTKNMKKFDL